MPVYAAAQTVLDAIAGFPLHRGILAIGARRAIASADALLSRLPARACVVALSGIANHDNMGGIFRNAAAFGADAVVMDADCCDPLYRKAIRVSVGAALLVPFARVAAGEDLVGLLHAHRFEVLGAEPDGRADAGRGRAGAAHRGAVRGGGARAAGHDAGARDGGADPDGSGVRFAQRRDDERDRAASSDGGVIPAPFTREGGCPDGVPAFAGTQWYGQRARYFAFPVQRSIHPSTSPYHCRELAGFSTQWFSLGLTTSRDGMPRRCSAVNAAIPCM